MSKEKLSKAARGRDASGSVIIELALVLPFLLLVIAGIVDLGLLYWEMHVITNASREGARAAAKSDVTTNPLQPSPAKEKTVTDVMAIVQNYLKCFKIKDPLKPPPDNDLVLAKNVTFFYTWDLSSSPGVLTVELKDIPVKLTLLPNIYGFSWSSDPVLLKARTTMAAEWSTAPLP
ncbi:MAG: TadE family protein [Pseudomonadota bacterium]